MNDPARTADQKEIERLHLLLRKAAYTLEAAGLKGEAADLRRALAGG